MGNVYNHTPSDYRCPFCRMLATGESDYPLEVLQRYDEVIVKLNPRWWPRNRGGALVIPIEHHENLYDLPPRLGTPIQEAARDTALAMKAAFGCDGVSTRQHNEPAGNQDVWHYHVHVFPRYEGDDLYGSQWGLAGADEMVVVAEELRANWPR
jgi:histidine triad (HIT) family protein